MAASQPKHRAHQSRGNQQRRPVPQHVGRWLDGWLQQDEGSVAADDGLHRLGIGVAGGQALADEDTDVVREVGAGFVDRLVLADQAAQLLRQDARARLERGIGELLGIAWKDKPEDARAWLAELGDPYRRLAVDRDGRVGIDFGVYGVPETYVIDRTGKIRYREAGPITPEDLKDKILPLLAELKR